jgi:thiol:disulfide interchange protein DsbD
MTCDDSKCLPSVDIPFNVNLSALTVEIGAIEDTTATPMQVTETPGQFKIDRSKVADCGNEPLNEKGKGIWGIFILGFLGGLVALLTPCVFPMIPLTVSYFTKGAENKKKGLFNAAMYGFFIFAVYLILSIPFHLLDSVNPDVLNEISTNVWLNLLFFVIFLVFAFSFFGYFELTLPSSWTNKASAAEGIGGLIGIFFMALTLALVSFSCTGPILGSLLAGALSADGGAWQLTAGMAGFGLALALPFGLFAAFPSWLNTLPKSGGWMTTLKVVLVFLELALALKFLSNADLVKHWGLLKIEPFLALWIIIFAAMGFYLLGKIRFPHDTPLKKLSAGRLILSLLSFGIAAYLATGFIYDKNTGSFKSLKLLSGLAPPAGYSWIYPKNCPQNLNCFNDFYQGLEYAKRVNKPIMLDFTGHACVNCRKMEEHVWPTKQVYSFLKDEYVLISLYVDEKVDLPTEEQIIVPKKTGGTRKLRTVGHKWQHFQTEHFNNNSQPFYALISPDGTLLAEPVGYMPEASEYAGFLKCGLDNFKALESAKLQKQ